MKQNKIIKLLTFITVLNVSSFILHSKDDENVSISNINVNINNEKNNYEEKERINIRKLQENDINEIDIIYNAMLSAFCIEEMNKRGVYSSSNGYQENELSEKYKKYSKILRINYPNCSRIYDVIGDNYKNESLQERYRAEYGEYY